MFGFATILLGALAGVLVGYVIGEGRAIRLRVQAQTALFQVDVERRLETALMVQGRLIAAALAPRFLSPLRLRVAVPSVPAVRRPAARPSALSVLALPRKWQLLTGRTAVSAPTTAPRATAIAR